MNIKERLYNVTNTLSATANIDSMVTDMNVRPTEQNDIQDIQLILKQTQLFPSDILPAMIDGFLSGDTTGGLWLSCEERGKAIGFCHAAPEHMTDGTWNMLAIAVLPAEQGKGYGRAITARLEAILADHDQRILIVNTSGTETFSRARLFYANNGYTEEARIRDFWASGDDKIVFWKSLR